MKVKRFKIERETERGWSRWVQPVPRGYLLACCDCGLVHWMDFRIEAGRVQFRAKRAPRYSAQRRRRNNRRLTALEAAKTGEHQPEQK